MKKSSSRSSLFSADRSVHRTPTIDPAQVCREAETVLADASRVLPHEHFAPLSFKLLKGLIRRAETESAHSQSLFLATICDCVERYGCNLQLSVRTLLLEVLCELNSSLLDGVGGKLEKVKHTVIHTPVEYLLAKAFLLEERWQLARGDETAALGSLRRCIDLTETHLVEYLQESEQVRQEIVDHVILAHYEHFRLRKGKKPTAALESLAKALSAARRSYGGENAIVRGLQGLYGQHEHLINNMTRSSRAYTQIVELQHKKHLRTNAFYSWEDDKIVAQLLRVRDGERQVLHETSYNIKLDIAKIKMLRGSGEWLGVEEGRVAIFEEDLLRALGVGLNSPPAKEATTRIEMHQLSRDQVIRKEEPSSSDDDDGLENLEGLKFLKHGRAQSSRKFKDTQ